MCKTLYLFDKNALLATGVISARLAGATRCFALSARGVKLFAARTGEVAAWVGGEDGGLVVEEATLETEEMDWWRWVAGRLERNP